MGVPVSELPAYYAEAAHEAEKLRKEGVDITVAGCEVTIFNEGIFPGAALGDRIGGVVPTRSEKEQADYVGGVLELLDAGDVDGVFIYVFSFPCYRFGEGAKDLDRVSYSLVKTFPDSDPRSKALPPWAPKEAFHRIAEFNRRYARSR